MMDDGSVSGAGYRISTNNFSYNIVMLFQISIFNRYGFKPTIQRHKKSWILYFFKKDMVKLSIVVKLHMIPSNIYELKYY